MPEFAPNTHQPISRRHSALFPIVAPRPPGWLVFLASCMGLALAATFTGRTTRGDETASPPNIVLIISDDQAWTDYSFQKHPAIHTPRLDRLAAESLTFTRGYVPSSLCCPSLMSIITGLYPHQHRITSNDPPLPAGKTGAAANQDVAFRAARQQMIANVERVPTLPRLLAERGYLSLHPAGIPHGPHPGTYEASIGKTGTEELAVMVDTFRPLKVTAQALPLDHPDYHRSWLEPGA